MTRVKGATHAIKRRRKLLGATKGYRFGRSTKERMARQAWFKAGQHSFADRRRKKSDFRGLWQTQIGAGSRSLGMSYSTFISELKKANISLNRKVLAEIASTHPETFSRIVSVVKK